MTAPIQELWEYKDFVQQYTLQQMRSRYRGSVLGFLWTLLNPLLFCSSLTLIFAFINHWDLRTAGVYFFSGYIPWLFFVNASSAATTSIVGNATYVSRIRCPRLVFPAACVLLNMIDLLVGLGIIGVLMVVLAAPVQPALLTIPVAVFLITIFVMGVCALFATLGTLLRDFVFLWGSVSFLLFFLTPILYPITQIPEPYRGVFELNPVLPFIRLFQIPIANGLWPSPAVFGQATVLAVVTFVLGLTVFVKNQKSFYLYL